MDRRTAKRIGTEVSKAIEVAGENPARIAEAIGLTSDEMNARLTGAEIFSAPHLVQIGGLLAVPASTLIGAAA